MRTPSVRVSRALVAGFVLVILYFIWQADIGSSHFVLRAVSSVRHADKLGHFALAFGVTLFAQLAIRRPASSRGLLGVTLGIAGLFFAEECSQLLFASRSFDLLDLAADLAAIGLAHATGHLFELR